MKVREKSKMFDTYQVKNDLAWIINDVVQNFVDGAKIMGIEDPVAAVKMKREGNSITFSGPSYFDVNYLFYVGASSKTGNQDVIGEKGEGLKIVTLLAMRDFGMEVMFDSFQKQNSWNATACWEEVSFDGRTFRELCWDVETFTTWDGESASSCRLEGPEAIIDQIEAMSWKEHFAGSHTNLLQDPITEQIFRLRPDQQTHGHLFLAGFDRGPSACCTFNYRLDSKLPEDNDRDRKTLSLNAQTAAMRIILGDDNEVPPEVYKTIISKKKELFIKSWGVYDPEVIALKENFNFKEYFKSTISLAALSYSTTGRSTESVVKRLGVIVVEDRQIIELLLEANIASVEEKMEGVMKGREVYGNSQLQEKSGILMAAAGCCGMAPLLIKIYADDDDSRSLVVGTFNESFVRLRQDVMEGSFGYAFEVYIHELSHKAGPDGSERFEAQVDENMANVLGNHLNKEDQPGHFRTMAKFCSNWNKLNKRKK